MALAVTEATKLMPLSGITHSCVPRRHYCRRLASVARDVPVATNSLSPPRLVAAMLLCGAGNLPGNLPAPHALHHSETLLVYV